MERDFLNIRTVLNVEKWQKIQNQISEVTGVAILLVDHKGIPVSEHSGCSDFCKQLRNDSKLSRNCYTCDARGGFEAARINDVSIYRCYCNIVDAAIPIVIDDIYVGAVMAGQVIIDDNEYLEKIYSVTEGIPIDKEEMLVNYNKLPHFSYDQMKAVVRMIWSVSNYIVEEAIKKYDLHMENMKLLRKKEEYENKSEPEELRLKSNYSSVNPYTNSIISNPIINSAITHINNNIDKNLTLNDMAELCFVSTGYFSKIFYKEIGENFSTYLTNLKIDKAKLLLKETNKSIQEITYELGFNDTSYFIRQFRKCEGTTPGNYRKVSKSNTKKYKIITNDQKSEIK